jgi:hypothetical protein
MRTQSILKGRFTILPGVELQQTGGYIWIVSVTDRSDNCPKTTIMRGSCAFKQAPDAWDDAGREALPIATQLD